jgi:hypothetical protein
VESADRRTRLERLRETVGDLNPLHILLVCYAVPIVGLFVLVCVGFVVLMFADRGFAQLVLFTLILGMILGLPEVLQS